MQIITQKKEMSGISEKLRNEGKTIAFVPTMGALHEGHTSLFDKAHEMADITVASIFVNPAQFAPNEDYNKYPRDIEKDSVLANLHKIDYLFMPDALEIYPIGFSTALHLKNITDKFEGKFRPGHFDGVALIVAKLFNIVHPHYAVFGQKDFQQTLVIKQMSDDLDFDIKIIISPTIRNSKGLALSSRNAYLSEDEQVNASIIYQAMEEAKAAVLAGERERKKINTILHHRLRTVAGLRIDYASAAAANDLSEPDLFYPNELVVIVIAVFIGKTRLIDNTLVTIPAHTSGNF